MYPAKPNAVRYPEAPRSEDVVDVAGTPVPDPYRPLEDVDAPATRAFIDEQNRLCAEFLAGLPGRDAIRRRLTELWDYVRFGLPFREGGRTFFLRNDGLQNQSVLHVVEEDGAEPRVLLDPNPLSSDGTVALAGFVVDRRGRRLAYGLSVAGSDWQEWRVRDVATGVDLPDRVAWVKYSSTAFDHDGDGFYYSRYDAPAEGRELVVANRDQRLCYHRIGSAQEDDLLVYRRPDQPEWGLWAQVSDDGRHLIINASHGTDPRSRLYHRDLGAGADAPVVPLVPEGDAAFRFVGSRGRELFLRTDWRAARGRVVALDLDRPDREAWREVVPESAHALTDVSLVGGRLFASYLEDAASRVRVFDLDGAAVGEVPLPGLGTASGFGGREDDRALFYSFTSFSTPATLHRLDVATLASQVWRAPTLRFDPAGYLTRQVFVSSRDGTRVPLFLSHRRDLPAGPRPTLLFGYGGFGISMTPAFDPARLAFMEMGGVLAVANLRGGGEYGEDWHRAGTRARKQNVFDDCIACAEWLSASGVSAPDRLALAGSSNGGLLVGACITQRPDLFAAALPDVGVLDMLRFHRFTIGWAWVSDYGSPDDPEDARALAAYSPLHNVRPGTRYPATLVTTADHDDRVVAAHSLKFTAALQAAQAGAAPVLLRVDVKAGHGAGKPTAKLIELHTDRWAFLDWAIGHGELGVAAGVGGDPEEPPR